jgi:hypothetical protein
MKLAIMQPYIFPYIGYFQLIHAVDKFVAYDDVTYIKQGWINRNKILLNGKEFIFTVPLKNASSFTTIAQTEINQNLYDGWRNKFYKTLDQAYRKAPFYQPVSELITTVFDARHTTIAELAVASITASSTYVGLQREFVPTATGYGNNDLKAKDRVLDICRKEKADVYVNPIGGKELYAKEEFAQSGITLHFVKSHNIVYPQFNNEFVPWLSIIDVMMFNAPADVMKLLAEYDLE